MQGGNWRNRICFVQQTHRNRKKMMNVLALALVISSLAVAGVWSPQPAIVKDHQQTHSGAGIIKEGHRVIVVEYERAVVSNEDQPHSTTLYPSTPSVVQEATEKAKEAASVLPNLGQGISTPVVEEEVGESKEHPVKEKICDAYGVCRDKIGGLFGKSKEKVEHVVKDAATEVGRKATDAKEKAKDVRDKVEDAKEKVKDKVGDVVEEMAQAKDEVKENLSATRKNLTDILRRGQEVLLDAMTYAKAPETLRSILNVVELMAFATAYGMCVWMTFVSSHVLAVALPRQQFGVVQSKIYPVYFKAMAYSITIAFLAHFFGTSGRWLGSVSERVQGYNFLSVLGLVLANMLFLEPKATKVMFERMKLEKEEGRGRDIADVLEPTTTVAAATAERRISPEQEATKNQMLRLNSRLKKLNSYSSLLNVLTLMGLTWHLVHLSRRLQGVVC